MKLYYFPRSPNCIPILAVRNHLGTDLELHLLDLFAGEHKKPDFLKLNPNGKMPTLQDGNFTLWESNAIMQYLATQKPNELWPSDDRIRADISRWQCWQLAHWGQAAGILAWENFAKQLFNAGDPDPVEVKKGEELFHGVGAVLNHHLEGRQYLVGNGPTLADFSVAKPMVYCREGRFPLEKYTQISRWYSRMENLDSWKKALPPPMGS